MSPYAVKHSLGRAWGFGALSCAIWTAVWLHRTRRLFDGELGHGRDDAAFHTVGAFVPVLNVFVLYWLYRDLDELRRRAGLAGIPVPVYVVGAVFAPVAIYSLALGKVNEYWDVRTRGLATDAPVTGGEKAVLAMGGAIWGLCLLAFAALLLFALT